MKSFIFLAFLISFASQASAATIHLGSVLKLTDLGVGVKPEAINNHGQIVGQDQSGKAFLWDNGTMTSLGTLGGSQSFANDISDNGTVVGWSFDANEKQKAFKWDTTSSTLQNLDPLSSLSSSAEAINLSDKIVGWKSNGSINRSSMWNIANPDGRLIFGGGDHKALGINDIGEIVGVTLDNNGVLDEGYFWDALGGDTDFSGGLGDNYFPFAGINNNSLTAGETFDRAAFMNINDRFESVLDLLHPSDVTSYALGLNDANMLVGQSGLSAFAYDLSTGELMDMNQFMKMGFEPDGLLRLTDINNAGQFVGIANYNGVQHGISGNVVVIPEPSTLTLLTFGLSDLVVWLFSSKKEEPKKVKDSQNSDLEVEATK